MSLTKKENVTALISALSALGGPKAAIAGQIANGAITYGPRAIRAVRKIAKRIRKARKGARPRGRGAAQGIQSMGPRTAAPVAISRLGTTGKPVTTMKDGVATISHSEFIADVATSSTMVPVVLEVNPTNATVFPWLSTIALNYQRYKFRRLRFRYVARTPTSTDGFVGMACLTDPVESVPDSKVTFMNVANAVSTSPWNCLEYELPASMLNAVGPTRMMRDPDGSYSDEVLPTFDVCRFIYAAIRTNSTTVGEMYVDYVVDCIDPATNIPAGSNFQYIRVSDGTLAMPNISTAETVPLLAADVNADGYYWLGYFGELGDADSDGYVPDLSLPPGTYFATIMLKTLVHGIEDPAAPVNGLHEVGVTTGGVTSTRMDNVSVGFNSLVYSGTTAITYYKCSFYHYGGPMQWFVTRVDGAGYDYDDIEFVEVDFTITKMNDGAIGVAPMTVVMDTRVKKEKASDRAAAFAKAMAARELKQLKQTTLVSGKPGPCSRKPRMAG